MARYRRSPPRPHARLTARAEATTDVEGRPAELVRLLGLHPHPEGGHYLEVFRSPSVVSVGGRGSRSAATHILFLLAEGERSRWHRIASDEIWHWYEGSSLDLRTIPQGHGRVVTRRLGGLDAGAVPVLDVQAGTWQAASTTGSFTLAGCTVAPGFEYADFELLADCPAERDRLLAAGVELGDLL
jgi:predicted cupin superfamily sugar epimerase